MCHWHGPLVGSKPLIHHGSRCHTFQTIYHLYLFALFVWLISHQPTVFSLKTNQPLATSQQYFSLRTNQHQPPAKRTVDVGDREIITNSWRRYYVIISQGQFAKLKQTPFELYMHKQTTYTLESPRKISLLTILERRRKWGKNKVKFTGSFGHWTSACSYSNTCFS
jgi:hypothetical protein